MKLVIVESPTKANTIGKFIGKEYKVESSYGHVRDLPRSRFGIDLEHNFEPTYIIPVKAKKRVSELRKIASKAKEIILASDEDREGEAIAWHLRQVLEGKGSKTKRDSVSVIEGKPVSRIVFHEITETAIKVALEHPRELDTKMVDAQQARRILDRLVGYKLSPFLWKKIAKGLSAGRVQSVALRLIVDRENEIRAFIPQEYWDISVLFKKLKGEGTVEASLIKIDDKAIEKFDIGTKNSAEDLVKALKNESYLITGIKKTETRKNPLPPFTTSTLQQTASSRLGFSAKKTMMFAQNLYENGLITYMRTDSVNLSKDSIAVAREWINKDLGPKYLLDAPRTFATKSKGAQEAHEAIRPTHITHPDDIIVSDEAARKLYRLIWQRFIATQLPPAVFDATSIDIQTADKKYTLRANGNMMKFDGFLKIYPQSFEEKDLPELAEGEKLSVVTVKPAQHFTEPPPRYSEAKLIKTLEEYGIGRPSTYVPIISVIQARNYVRKEAGRFIPTEIGELVSKVLTQNFPEIVDVNFTAQIEEKLDAVAEGTQEWHQLLADFYTPFAKHLEEKYNTVEKEHTDELTEDKCEKCGKFMMVKFGRFGKFLACSGFPECKNAKNMGGVEPVQIGMKCPKCLIGEVVVKQTRKGRKKIFWGCSRYAKEGGCDWASWNDPTKTPEQIAAEKAELKEKKKTKEPKAEKGEKPERIVDEEEA
jgi:DNA topoisomerase-1